MKEKNPLEFKSDAEVWNPCKVPLKAVDHRHYVNRYATQVIRDPLGLDTDLARLKADLEALRRLVEQLIAEVDDFLKEHKPNLKDDDDCTY